MRVYPELTVDGEFKALGDLGFTGALNDRQFSFLRNRGFTNSLTDMFGQYRSWTPTELFNTAGSRGFFYDFSDYSTMFGDTAGTTPVTGVGQSVGLVLDESRGLALGPELVTNGDFASAANWLQIGSSVSITGGALVMTSAANNSGYYQSSASYAGSAYEITVVVTSIASGAVTVTLGIPSPTGANCFNITAAGTYTFRQANFTADTNLRVYSVGASTTASVDSVSVRSIPGNHATQATAGSRALTQVRPMGVTPRNLLTFSEAFDNAAWTKQNCTILANSAIAPDGTSTADKIRETAVTAPFSVGAAPTMALNTTHTLSVYMKAAERNFGVLNIFTGAASCWTWYDLASGTVGTVGSGATASISSVGNGWYRCVLTIATAASGSPNVAMWPAPANNTLTYAGTLDSGILLWGAQLEVGSTASTYQPTGPALINGEKRNLLTFTEQFDNASSGANTNLTVSANTTVAPDGTVSADTATRATTNTLENVRRVVTSQIANTAHTFSCYVKANTAGARLYMRNLAVDNTITTGVVQFNPADGTVSTTFGSVYAGKTSMVSVGDGWWRCSITGTTTATISTNFIDLGVTDGSSAVGGASGNSVFLWGAQLELGPTPTAYQRVVTANEWYEPGFTSYRGIQFDGVDDFLQTAAIDFSNSDKMTVVAGVRKLSDAAVSIVTELTVNSNTENGSFYLTAPQTVAANFGFASKGTVQAVPTGSGFPAPLTAVQTGVGDISGDVATLRINGSQVAQLTSDQGTGNYANAAVYIGRRAGSSLPFNGVLTFLCVINRTLTASELAQLEAFANGKTGAY